MNALTRRILAALTLLALLLPVPPLASAQPAGEAERFFQVEYGPPVARRGHALEGYVYSTHQYRVGGMRLRVDVLDADGRKVKEGFGWVPGDVPAGGRAYFLLPLPERGASYKVSVVSYYLVSRDAP